MNKFSAGKKTCQHPRLLLINGDGYPPFRVDVTILFIKKLVERGFRLDWILTARKPFAKSKVIKGLGGAVIIGKRLEENGFANKLINRIYSLTHETKIFKLLGKNDYDIVQVKDKFITAVMAIIAAKLHKIPFTFWLSYPYQIEAQITAKKSEGIKKLFYLLKYHFINMILMKIIFPYSTHVFVQSDKMKQDFVDLEVSANKVTAVPMGVSIDDMEAAHKKATENRTKSPPRVAYLGVLNRIRRVDFIIRVFALIADKYPDLRLLFVGGADKPEEENFLWEEAERLGVNEKMEITGFLPMQEAWSKLRSNDIGISFFEPSPIYDCASPTKIIEYMALEMPAVALEHPDQSKIINESRGGICAPYNEQAFADAIEELLNDPEKSRQMGVDGRQYVIKHRDYESLSERVEQVYLSLCGNN